MRCLNLDVWLCIYSSNLVISLQFWQLISMKQSEIKFLKYDLDPSVKSDFPPQGNLTMSKHNFDCVFVGIWCIDAKDAAKCPTVHSTASYQKELSDPKCP